VRTNEQMMQAMKGATGVLGSMNRSMNLPALQRIAMEFEKENDIMDQRQEIMDDAIDDVTGLEDEAEGEEVVEQVLEEIGVDLRQAVSCRKSWDSTNTNRYNRWAKPQQGFRPPPWEKAESHKLLEGVVVIQEIMIFKLDLTVCGVELGGVNCRYTTGVRRHREWSLFWTLSHTICSLAFP
jgi:hypothetical protein